MKHLISPFVVILILFVVLPLTVSLLVPFWIPPIPKEPDGNSIFIIEPYKSAGTWVFDDPDVGLVREPFVSGIPEMIDKLVEDIPEAEKGFRLLFSAKPFPGYTLKLIWRREAKEGNWYYCEKFKSEGWLCPALFKYFKKAPKEIYAKAESKTPKSKKDGKADNSS